jgi:hypothetical protein
LIAAESDATMMHPRRLKAIAAYMSRCKFKKLAPHAFLVTACALMVNVGCTVSGLSPPLPDQIAGFSLKELADIQNNSALTDDERRQQIRDATGAPNNADGDRLVEFLLNLIIQ